MYTFVYTYQGSIWGSDPLKGGMGKIETWPNFYSEDTKIFEKWPFFGTEMIISYDFAVPKAPQKILGEILVKLKYKKKEKRF